MMTFARFRLAFALLLLLVAAMAGRFAPGRAWGRFRGHRARGRGQTARRHHRRAAGRFRAQPGAIAESRLYVLPQRRSHLSALLLADDTA